MCEFSVTVVSMASAARCSSWAKVVATSMETSATPMERKTEGTRWAIARSMSVNLKSELMVSMNEEASSNSLCSEGDV
jgi:hypothetical protein